MSFRKRNVPLNQSSARAANSGTSTVSANASIQNATLPGTRASTITSHMTTSTGTPSLDKTLGLGTGLALGSILLIEEHGTTDFSGALLRAFAAEGILQGHKVVVVGEKGWGSSLPGLVEEKDKRRNPNAGSRDGGEPSAQSSERMKIAWRYERLGNKTGFDEKRGTATASDPTASSLTKSYCHSFDLAKRLIPPAGSQPIIYTAPTALSEGKSNPFDPVLKAIESSLQALSTSGTVELVVSSSTSATDTVVRVVMPVLLNPLFYPPACSESRCLIHFLHGLHRLTRQYSNRLVVMLSWPLALYSRTHINARYAEQFSDGVLIMRPFPHSFSIEATENTNEDQSGSLIADASRDTTKAGSASEQEKTQGLVQIYKLPILTERGRSVGSGEDLAFAVSRRKFVIRPFYLPPLDAAEPLEDKGHDEHKDMHGLDDSLEQDMAAAEKAAVKVKMPKAKDLEF